MVEKCFHVEEQKEERNFLYLQKIDINTNYDLLVVLNIKVLLSVTPFFIPTRSLTL